MSLPAHSERRRSAGEFDLAVVGGGAAGFFAAATVTSRLPLAQVSILEQSATFLTKVRISGGGRCNVTHACFDPRELAQKYPRGGKELLGAFHRFQPQDTIAWFEQQGIRLKTEGDGRVFPVTDLSQTIVDCLLAATARSGVQLEANRAVERIEKLAQGGFELWLRGGESLKSRLVMLATGGCRAAAAGNLATQLGHTVETPVPSLFSFHLQEQWLKNLAGISVGSAGVSLPGTRLHEAGPLLITHEGVSGPAILRLSAWGARHLAAANYRTEVRLNWWADRPPEAAMSALEEFRRISPSRLLLNCPLSGIPARLWEALVFQAGIPAGTRCSNLARAQAHALVQQILETRLSMVGKSLNKDEFVTCGGVCLREVDFKTMQSRLCPGLFFGGELLDIDGLTGGFNFQAAWTTGWIAGTAIAHQLSETTG